MVAMDSGEPIEAVRTRSVASGKKKFVWEVASIGKYLLADSNR